MAFTIGNSHGQTNGVTAVTVVAAPATDEFRIIKNITIFNNDTAAKEFELQLVDGATTRVIKRSGSVAANSSWEYANTLTLDATTKSIKVVLTAAKTTNDCDWTAHYLTEA